MRGRWPSPGRLHVSSSTAPRDSRRSSASVPAESAPRGENHPEDEVHHHPGPGGGTRVRVSAATARFASVAPPRTRPGPRAGSTATLSQAQARRIALAAQGFLDPPHAPPTMRTLARTLARTGVLQVDSVNVLQRAHYMPLYSRMGPYDVDLLRRASEVAAAARWSSTWPTSRPSCRSTLWPVMQHRMAALPRRSSQVVGHGLHRRADREPAGRDRRPWCLDRARPRRRAAAREGALGVELVDHPPGARLHVHGRRRGDRRPQQPVRDPLRPARACHPRRVPRGTDPERARGGQGAGPPGGALARRRHA